MPKSKKETLLTGIKPSGRPHLGNYLTAIKSCVDHQNTHNSFVFIADLHALTTVKSPTELQSNIFGVILDYLACGLDPDKVTFFQQSTVPEHTELSWILSCLAPFGQMERSHAWKDAVAKNLKDPTVGLFTYPVLMAADILLYQPDIVPVGIDQKQHVEIARDLAQKFNHRFGETFKLPEPDINEKVASLIGTDGEHKMSKSYGNIISLFNNPKTIESQVMFIKTDSLPLEAPKNPETDTVFNIYQHFATPSEIENLRDKYVAGGFGYGHAKKILLEKLNNYFEPMRAKRIELEGKMDYIKSILEQGTKKARKISSKKMMEIKQKIGLLI